MNEDPTVVILAAGLGTRMRSARAKVLHEAGGDTLLNHVIRAALSVTQPDRIIVVVGHQAEQVRASVTVPGIRFAEQREQLGTGHAVMSAREALPSAKGAILILNGDGPLLRASTLESLTNLQRGSNLGGAIVTTMLADPTGYGRIVRDDRGHVAAIIEQKACSPEQLSIREVNPGVYCFNAELFWAHIDELRPDNPANEYYLTDMASILSRHGHPIARLLVDDESELLGINTRVDLAVADRVLRTRKVNDLMLAGVTIESPETVTIDHSVEVGEDTVIEANVQLRGKTSIGKNCRIGTGTVLRSCRIADSVTALPYVVADSSSIGKGASIGPFTRLRMNSEAAEGTHIGNFVELKKTKFGVGSKAGHLAYLGDTLVGPGVNIGAGTITCNYDGKQKHVTNIAGGVFVGSNATLVAPVSIGEGAYVAAASVITKNVSPDALAIGRAHQTEKPGWARRRKGLPPREHSTPPSKS
ncbi:MAG TPA: bifunctional UDP-N-acetylglucosamine diphosphorylase/glucosamine-1-phosphate N-acetyltransferase GlmU [Bryobacteraceae bacterium]|jgi:bifunctional UDP-N-acetylglucosamine pyrophosphorylase/glucosamine-1-phosphate N-acetyltransferase|nr:bifunctional UDP-N-acetylglucosamine diphosphorylase/glucosamine-1-phosphate N-acetyltransferase GlmU [Bryobacteraceae bacterium]